MRRGPNSTTGGGSQARVILVAVVGMIFLFMLHASLGGGMPASEGPTTATQKKHDAKQSPAVGEEQQDNEGKDAKQKRQDRYHGDDLNKVQKEETVEPADQNPAAANTIKEQLKSCDAATDCYSCLHNTPLDPEHSGESRSFPPSQDHKVAPVPLSSCVWCASRAKCMHANVVQEPKVADFANVQDYKGQFQDATQCDDIEDASCPAVLSASTVPPQNMRVIHVAIRKGGPEALVQMFLALSHWGFKTTLDTRKSKKEKGGELVPFFKQVYKDEFQDTSPLRYANNFAEWTSSGSEGDVLLATETWRCPTDGIEQLSKGVRYMQWHLTVWPRKDRSSCTIATHTHYIAVDYMRQSARSLMFPYISPHIVQLAMTQKRSSPQDEDGATSGWKNKKTDLVMYDSDTKLKDSDLRPITKGVSHDTKIATGYTPEALYALYGKMKAGIDLKLPGGERMVYEAALFDVCIVVDSSSNGGDALDFPVPERFRVKLDFENAESLKDWKLKQSSLPALNKAVDECVGKYSSVIPEFAPFKNFVLSQRATFYRQVRRYYSNSVHVVTVVNSEDELVGGKVSHFIAGVITQFPFATIEVQVMQSVFIDAGISTRDGGPNLLKNVLKKLGSTEAWKSLSANSYLASVTIVRIGAGGSGPGGMKTPMATSTKQSLYTMLLPKLEQFLFPREDTIHLLGNLLKKLLPNEQGMLMGEGLFFARTRFLVGKQPQGEREAFAPLPEAYVKALTPILMFSSTTEEGAGKESKDFLCQHVVPKDVMKEVCNP